jgi:1,4-dihydroxy-2-naphthoate octaprenyltransferase
MKKIKVSLFTFLVSLFLCGLFGWTATVIIVFFAIFFLNIISDRVEDRKRAKKSVFVYYIGQLISVFLGCLLFYAIIYLKTIITGS